MKKTITMLLILFLSLGLFAETGYAGIQWGTPKEEFSNLKEEDEHTLSEQRVMLNKETTRYYYFGNGCVWAISYSLPEDKTEEIKSKFKELSQKQKLKELTEDLIIEYLDRQNLQVDEKNKEIALNKIISMLALAYSAYGIPETITEGNGTVYAYNYNDDTRVYIFEKMVEAKTVVVYTYFEQDY